MTLGQLLALPCSSSFLDPLNNWRAARASISASLGSGAANGAATAREAKRVAAKNFILRFGVGDDGRYRVKSESGVR
jgi:hypothetical protein